VPASDGSPTGFPTLFIGEYSGHQTQGSNLPKQVSALTTVPTVFSTDASLHDTSNFNATYDVWFTATSAKLATTASSPGTGGAYLMVWLYKPLQRQPRGGIYSVTTGTTPNHPAHSVTGMSGTWDVWVDSSTNPPCISYVSTTAVDSLDFDLNKFIQDSVTNSYGVTSSMYLSIVFAGFEIWSGGDGLNVKQFCAQVN
jgi:cellulose 1,4-beta-cellobiosidase